MRGGDALCQKEDEERSKVLGGSSRKGYTISHIKLHVMSILFIACFECAVDVFLIG